MYAAASLNQVSDIKHSKGHKGQIYTLFTKRLKIFDREELPWCPVCVVCN